jgi:GNAT superfamily N-acetyltransferase
MSSHVEFVDTRTAPDETLTALHDLHILQDEEVLPGDPPVPLQQRMLDWRNQLDTEGLCRWVVWKGPEIVATSGLQVDLIQNLQNAYGWVYVHPQHRGSSYGRAVATPLLDAAEADGRTRFAIGINDGRSEEALAERAGMKSAYREKVSRLIFDEIDWTLMESWMARATERASDYELLFLPSPIDEANLQAYCDMMFVMNSAPQEDYVEDEDEVMTPEIWRDIEAKIGVHAEREILTYVARHRPTGKFAGFTTVAHKRLQPDLVEQWDTGVDPDHRNKGIGRWVKAAMAFKLRELYPTIRRIDTENAGSNAPMLGINIEMGFRPILIQNVWQGDLAAIRAGLSV